MTGALYVPTTVPSMVYVVFGWPLVSDEPRVPTTAIPVPNLKISFASDGALQANSPENPREAVSPAIAAPCLVLSTSSTSWSQIHPGAYCTAGVVSSTSCGDEDDMS